MLLSLKKRGNTPSNWVKKELWRKTVYKVVGWWGQAQKSTRRRAMARRQQPRGAVASPGLEGRHGMITAQDEQLWPRGRGRGQQTETGHLVTENSDPKWPRPRRRQGHKDPFLMVPQACQRPLGGVQQKPRVQRSQIIQNTLVHFWAGDPREEACGTRRTELLQMLPNILTRVALLYHHVELEELAKS